MLRLVELMWTVRCTIILFVYFGFIASSSASARLSAGLVLLAVSHRRERRSRTGTTGIQMAGEM